MFVKSSCLSSQLHFIVNDDDESDDGDEIFTDANDNRYNGVNDITYNDANDNKYNDDKVHSLAAMEAGIVTMALTNPLQVFLSTLSASKWENLWDLLVNK